MKKTRFSIHLFQDEDGNLSAVAEAVGDQSKPYEIGYEIMASLEKAAFNHPDLKLRIQELNYSERLQ